MKSCHRSTLQALFILLGLCSSALSATPLKVATFNIMVDFLSKGHPWEERRGAVLHAISHAKPHLIAFQEVSPEQGEYLVANMPQFEFHFAPQAPSRGYVRGENIGLYNEEGRRVFFTGFAIDRDRLEYRDKYVSPFTFTSEQLPNNDFLKTTEKGFRDYCMNPTVFALRLKDKITNQKFLVTTSHYPLGAGSDTRQRCALSERGFLNYICASQKLPWISLGDRNIIPATGQPSGTSDYAVLEPLLEDTYNASDAKIKTGYATTFAGFSQDHYKNPLVDGKFVWDNYVLDVIISTFPAKTYGTVLVEYDQKGRFKVNPETINEARRFASDHLMVTAEYEMCCCPCHANS